MHLLLDLSVYHTVVVPLPAYPCQSSISCSILFSPVSVALSLPALYQLLYPCQLALYQLPSAAHIHDNCFLAGNYGLAGYGASKVMQTLQFAKAIYSRDSKVNKTSDYTHLNDLFDTLDCPLNKAREHWEKNPASAAARQCPDEFVDLYGDLVDAMSNVALDLYEDTDGPNSAIWKLFKQSPRFNVVKMPYMLPNTAVNKRFFVFISKIRRENCVGLFQSMFVQTI